MLKEREDILNEMRSGGAAIVQCSGRKQGVKNARVCRNYRVRRGDRVG